jgi:AcrR family transcriptional regulator
MTEKENYHHGDLRQAIIQEALVWIETENIVSLSLRKIARQIGVSHNAPYRHFPDKESLLFAIAEMGFGQLRQALQQALLDSPEDVQKRLENLGIAHVKYAVNHQAYYRVMFSDSHRNCQKDPRLKKISEETFEILLNAIKAGQEAQVFNSEDSWQLARICWSLVHGISILAIDNQLMVCEAVEIVELAQIATKTMTRGMIG